MQKRLVRSQQDKMLGGVCAGLGYYFGIDPTVVRVAFVLSIVMLGVGVIPYLLLWVIMPER